MSIHFANPWALLLLLSLVPAVLWARRSMAGLGRARGSVALVLRAAIIILVTLALAQAQWSFTQDDLSVIYALDESYSIPPGDQKRALDYVLSSQERRRSKDAVGMVLFGRTAALERRPEAEPLLKPPGPASRPTGETASLQSVISPQRTNIAGALRLALAAFPAGGRKRIVLLSDGNENVGSAAEEAEVARKNGVRVDVWPVRYEYKNEVMVEKVIAPAEAEKKAGFEVRTVVTAMKPQSALVRLYENGTLIGAERVDLKEGRNVLVAQRHLAEPGHYTYSATVEAAEDTLYANNQASAFTMVRGQGRVLYVEGDPEHAQALRAALAAQGLDVKAVGGEALPPTISDLIPYDSLILSNIAAGQLGEEGMRAIELAVKDWGVGLVMVGGENAYGPGGYQDSPVERALPVSMDVKERRILPSGALVIVLHTCEIAQGNYWARQIALAALKVLSPTDEFGVIDYDWNGGEKWVFDLQRVRDKQKLANLINQAQPGDMPSFITALQMAHASLKKSNASIKHVVIISDGDPAYPSDHAVLDMLADKITISTVGINPHSDLDGQRLLHVAILGKGRYYEPQSSAELPQIFIKEAATVRRAQIFEEPFKPRLALSSEVIKGIASGEYPILKGYVVTTPKDLAEVPLITQHRDPLLAHWQYGLGRAVAFTSDAKARWAAEWLPWDKYQQFWAQIVRWSARNIQGGGVRVRPELVNDRVHLTIDAVDKQGRFMNNVKFNGLIVTPDHREVPVTVEQTGPGRYEAEFDAGDEGAHYVSFRYTDAEGKAALYSQGLVVPYSAEYRELKANDEKLRALAEATGGRVLTAADDVFARTFAPTPRFADAWPMLLLAAVLIVPADVFVRRVFVDRREVVRLAMWVAERVPLVGGRARRRGAVRPEYVAALLTRKQLTREELQRRGTKYQPVGTVQQVLEPGLGPPGEETKPKVAPVHRPTATEPKTTVQRDEDTYTGRLLRAKRKFKGGEDDPAQGGKT